MLFVLSCIINVSSSKVQCVTVKTLTLQTRLKQMYVLGVKRKTESGTTEELETAWKEVRIVYFKKRYLS